MLIFHSYVSLPEGGQPPSPARAKSLHSPSNAQLDCGALTATRTTAFLWVWHLAPTWRDTF